MVPIFTIPLQLELVVDGRVLYISTINREEIRLFKTKKSITFIIVSVIICLSIILMIVYDKHNSETQFLLEENCISSIYLISHAQSRALTNSETKEFVRRFNLFDVYRQNNPKYAVASDSVYIGTPVRFIISFTDKSEITISTFAEGVYNLGGEIKSQYWKTVCSAAGVVKKYVCL